MTKLTVFQETDGKISGFSMQGHTGRALRGEDIVCAGASALSQAALLGIHEHLHRDMEYQHASGKLEMKLKGAPDDLTEAILQTMLLGLREIEKLYPENLCIRTKSTKNRGEFHVPV